MDSMEEKLGAILNNPQMMQQIMSLASSLGSSEQQKPETLPPQAPELPNLDIGMLQKLSGLAGRTAVDQNQQTLLHALSPYLSRDRINRLERAMRAAKTARIATDLLGNGGLSFLTGR